MAKLKEAILIEMAKINKRVLKQCCQVGTEQPSGLDNHLKGTNHCSPPTPGFIPNNK